jgi:hypothetical protein
VTAFRYVLAALVAVFAVLQLNDPDPAVWLVAYGLVALCVAAPPYAALVSRLSWLTGGVLLTLALIALPGFFGYLTSGDLRMIAADMSPEKPYVEPAREFLGVAIAGAILIGVRYRRPRVTPSV